MNCFNPILPPSIDGTVHHDKMEMTATRPRATDVAIEVTP